MNHNINIYNVAATLSTFRLPINPLYCSSGRSIKDLNTVMKSAAVASSTCLWSKLSVAVMTQVGLIVSGSMMVLPPPTARIANWGVLMIAVNSAIPTYRG